MRKRVTEHYLVSSIIGILLFLFAAYPVFFGDEPLWAVLTRKGWVLTMPSWYYSFVLLLGCAVVILQVVLIRAVSRHRQKDTWLETVATEDSRDMTHRVHWDSGSENTVPHLNASEPYVDLTITLLNSSIYTLTLTEVEGKMTFHGRPLHSTVEILNTTRELKHAQYYQLQLRQWLQPNTAQIILTSDRAEFIPGYVALWFTYQDQGGTLHSVRIAFGNAPFVVKELSAKDAERLPTQNPVRKERAIPTLNAQQALISTLASYGGDPANVKIQIAAPIHRPLGETLASNFRLAKWQTEFFNIPLETQTHTHISGIEVIGYNKHLVEVVTDALKNAGLTEAKATAKEPEIKQESPKWDYVQRHIHIIIGYYE
jgi:hypothetical protein